MIDLEQQALTIFLDRLASRDATPGGGSAAAIMGGMAAALTSMVCHLTLGKKNYAAVEADMQALLDQAETLRQRFLALLRDDVAAFDQVMAAYGLPKDSAEEKQQRSLAIQNALRVATETPMACAQAALQALQLSLIAAEKGNVNLISDAGVAAMAGYAALKSAAFNVYVNTQALKDKDFCEQKLAELSVLLTEGEALVARVDRLVTHQLTATGAA